MKKNAFVIVMGLIMALPITAQSWNSWDTHRTISGVFGIANAAIESAERKKEMEIQARQKVEFERRPRTLRRKKTGRRPLRNMKRPPT